MRQTSKRARRSRLLMIFILVLLIALVLWGLAALADRLLHYGANATVSAKDADQPSAITPTPETADDTPKNTYDPACFYRDGEFLRYESSTVTSQIGIDVSAHQQDIDWQAVADSGIAFAVIRAGYRGYGKGSIVEDDRFRQNVAGARAAGLRVGLYFFSQAVTPEEAAEEAQWLVDAARDYKIDMPLVFDWENIDQSTVAAGDTVRTAEMTGEDVTACAVAFCETVTAAGYDAAVYGNRWQGYYDYDFTQLKDYAFWVSAPGTADDFYYAHDFWQYSYDGTVPGISGSVDRDLWFVPITT